MDAPHPPPPPLGRAATAFVSADDTSCIGGVREPLRSGDTLPVIDPGTGHVIGEIPASGSGNIDEAVLAGGHALESATWSRICAVPVKADDLDGATAPANDAIDGLNASIWMQNLRTAHQVASRIKSPNVCINTHNFFDPAFPIGGYKRSGWGRAAGFAAIEHYTEVKGIVAHL